MIITDLHDLLLSLLLDFPIILKLGHCTITLSKNLVFSFLLLIALNIKKN